MKRNNLQIDELQAFVAVAEKASFRAAADALFISAPALSRRIERLETALDTRLLERTTRRVTLTAVGRQFLEHARQILDHLDLAAQHITDTAALRKGVVTVACIPSVAQQLLPGALVEFAKLYPDVRVKVADEGAQEVLAQVVGGTADFGLNFMGAQEPGLDFLALCRETYLLAVRPDHPLARRSAIAWSELVDEKLISVSRGSGNRLLIDNALSRLSHRPVAFHEVNHVATLIQLVQAGLGVGAVPSLSLNDPSRLGVVGIPLIKPAIHRMLGLISRREQPLSPSAAALYALLRKRGAARPAKPASPLSRRRA